MPDDVAGTGTGTGTGADPGDARRQHWHQAWTTKPATATSWYQLRPSLSLELIRSASDDRHSAVIDIGGGASTLVDGLIEDGWRDISVLDISGAAMAVAQHRLGVAAAKVRWLEIDLLDATLLREYAIWHDRAVFHFLTDAVDRERYRRLAESSVRIGGQLVIGSFAEDGPTRCSGLPVQQYSSLTMAAALGDAFELLETRRETHLTPSGTEQRFVYGRFIHRGSTTR